MSEGSKSGAGRRGFLMRLRHDARGNTLAIMAAFLIPLMTFAGCAIDGARLYAAKARLQQACDAGVLAGRKAMTDATVGNTTLDETATSQANSFFANNFRSGWLQVSAVSFTPSKTSDAQVAGTARATVPMTILTFFGMPSRTISVQCQARFDIADTDIIFVLDTTGSMACLPSDSTSTCNSYVNDQISKIISYSRPTDAASGNKSMAGYAGSTGYYVPEKTGSRIAALRSAVLDFYDTMAANVDSETHVRYGFVTYTSTVNAGRAIVDVSPTFMVGGAGNGTTQWTYQSRRQDGDATSTSTKTYNDVTKATCDGYNADKSYSSSGTGTGATTSWTAASGSTKSKCVVTTTTYTPKWIYQPVALDVSAYVTGASVTDPTKVTGATTSWLGCIEERDTTAGATSFTTSSLPFDLDSSLTPTADASRWRPMWPEVIYMRNGFGTTNTSTATSTGDSTDHPPLATSYYYSRGWISCGKPVQRLKEMTRAEVSTYVNATDFRPVGGTYHDTGMIWGTRLLDPTGIFAADTSAWTGRTAPNRVIVFLTDGDMAPSAWIYGMYGVEAYDKRVSGGSFSDSATYKNFHNKRFLAECSKAKSLKIDVWTVTIGSSATTEMQSCATVSTQALYTTTGSGLSTTFATIAKQVAMLRLVQ
ncbi:MAG: Tad domain-containing protein [Sphingobium sp.]